MSEQADTRQLVVFTIGTEQYALPIEQVHEIIRYTLPRPVASSDTSVCGVINLRGRIVPVHDLATRLGVTSDITEGRKIVIVETDTETAGVIVDDVEEVLTVSHDQLALVPAADTALIDSIVRLNERLIVLLNPDTVLPEIAATAA